MSNDAVIERFQQAMTALGARFIIDTRCDHFREPALAEALTVWQEHAGPTGIPKRRDLTPKVMQSFLKRVAVFERVDRPFGTYRYRARLTGQEFTLAYAEMSGKFLDEVLPKKFLVRWKLLGDVVLAWGKPIRYLTPTEAFSRDYSVLEQLMAPMLDDAGNATLLLFVGNFERGQDWAAVEAAEAAFLEAQRETGCPTTNAA
jgi:hypothetical protein